MKQKRLERKYNKDDLISQMMNFDLIYRKVLLQNNVKSNSKKNISRVLTCKRTLSNIRSWHILQIIPEFCNVFVNKPTVAFKRNQDLICGHLIKDEKVAKKQFEKRQDKRKTCNTTRLA